MLQIAAMWLLNLHNCAFTEDFRKENKIQIKIKLTILNVWKESIPSIAAAQFAT